MAIDPRLWDLLSAVVKNGASAWPELLTVLEPELAQMAKRQPIGRLRDREDSPREIVTRAIARLHAREFAAVKKLVELDPPPELQAWLRVLVRRSAIDYMRESPEYERGNATRPDRWVSLASLSSSGPAAPVPDSLVQKRDAVMMYVKDAAARAAAENRDHGEDAIARLSLEWKIGRIHVRRLIARADQYVSVLTAVLAGYSYPEIAERLTLSRREVELTVRYIEELLQARHFGVTEP